MPELPEVEAWVRELDPLVSARPIEQAGPAHIATLKTFDPPLSALDGRQLEGAERRGKNLLFAVDGDDLVLRIHLMSAGRLRYLAPEAKGPKTPMFRLQFEGGAELVLTEGGRKKRAGVWLVTHGTLDEDLAHLGPDALELDESSWTGSAGSFTRCCATSAPSPASAAPTRTRSCCGPGFRRSRPRPI
jgi:formamidopyrimidine-DNA glycosylase